MVHLCVGWILCKHLSTHCALLSLLGYGPVWYTKEPPDTYVAVRGARYNVS